VGDTITLWGAIDCDLLIRGAEEDVAREVEYDITQAGPGGGLVITSGNTIMVGVAYENYMAMLRAVREKGRYPIRRSNWTKL
jgi:uroporphyrinogen decarboxylase